MGESPMYKNLHNSRNAAIKNTSKIYRITTLERRYFSMKGYYTSYGYMGYVEGTYKLFATESDYIEYVTN